MAAFDKTDVRSAEAGLKYFLFGSTSSAFTLFGISLIYGMSGSTGLAVISEKLAGVPAQPLLATGIIMTLIGFAFKIAAAPFHLWAPDAYQGAPILAVLAALSILIGNLVALAQTNVRRLLAYSAVAHAGYTLLGLVAGGRDGFSATLFYAVIYAITLVGAFGVVAVVRSESGGDDLENFSGLAARSPLLAGCMAIFMFSLAGIPPLAGFFGKFYLFSATLRSGRNHDLLWLVALALFGSFVSIYYYLIVLKAIFVEQPSRTAPALDHVSSDLLQQITVTVIAAAILFFGIMPDILASRILAAMP
jgi:NADH-quinone oxidoreductase subunit N